MAKVNTVGEVLRKDSEKRGIDPHAICRKWVQRLGGAFHPDTRGVDYTPALDADDVAVYDHDMESLFKAAADPYECAVMAMADAGWC